MPGHSGSVLYDVIASQMARHWRRSGARRLVRSLTVLGWCAVATIALTIAGGVGVLVH